MNPRRQYYPDETVTIRLLLPSSRGRAATPLCCRHPGGASRTPFLLSSSRGRVANPGTQRRATARSVQPRFRAPLPGERGWGVGVRYDLRRTVTPHPLTLRAALRVTQPLAALTGAQALSRREREENAMRGVFQQSPYGRCLNPCQFNPLTFPAPKFPASPPTAPIIPPSRRPGARSAGDPQRRRERMERAQPGAGSRQGSLAEGMRGRAGWKAGRPRGRGGYPHRSRRWSLPSLPAVCRRTPRQQRGPRSAHVEARPRGASDVRRNTCPHGLRADARRSAHAPITAAGPACGASVCP
jgi:hypothetical protein